MVKVEDVKGFGSEQQAGNDSQARQYVSVGFSPVSHFISLMLSRSAGPRFLWLEWATSAAAVKGSSVEVRWLVKLVTSQSYGPASLMAGRSRCCRNFFRKLLSMQCCTCVACELLVPLWVFIVGTY